MTSNERKLNEEISVWVTRCRVLERELDAERNRARSFEETYKRLKESMPLPKPLMQYTVTYTDGSTKTFIATSFTTYVEGSKHGVSVSFELNGQKVGLARAFTNITSEPIPEAPND